MSSRGDQLYCAETDEEVSCGVEWEGKVKKGKAVPRYWSDLRVYADGVGVRGDVGNVGLGPQVRCGGVSRTALLLQHASNQEQSQKQMNKQGSEIEPSI